MAEVKWIKVYTNMFSGSRKMKLIEAMPEGDAIVVIWLKLLLLAGDINDGGAIYVTPDIPYTDETLATQLNKPLPVVRMAYSVLQTFGMIVADEEGYIYIKNWEEYQSVEGLEKIREQNRERKRLQRERQKQALLDKSQDVTGQVTGRHAIEEEKDKDSEKESHSFIHTAAESTDESRRRYLQGIGKGVVFLSDEQISDLLDKMSVEEFDKYVGIIAECERAGRHYKKKTHYQAILEMAIKDRKIAKGD